MSQIWHDDTSETLAASIARAEKFHLRDNDAIAAFSRHQKRIHEEWLKVQRRWLIIGIVIAAAVIAAWGRG